MLSVSLFVHEDTEILGEGTKAPQSFLSDVMHPIKRECKLGLRGSEPLGILSPCCSPFPPRDSC